MGLPNQVQAATGQLPELRGAEVSGPVLRMDAGNMQRLTAQVIAHPCHHALVLQQPHETAPIRLVIGIEGHPVECAELAKRIIFRSMRLVSFTASCALKHCTAGRHSRQYEWQAITGASCPDIRRQW